jgi:hypothetical protein
MSPTLYIAVPCHQSSSQRPSDVWQWLAANAMGRCNVGRRALAWGMGAACGGAAGCRRRDDSDATGAVYGQLARALRSAIAPDCGASRARADRERGMDIAGGSSATRWLPMSRYAER